VVPSFCDFCLRTSAAKSYKVSDPTRATHAHLRVTAMAQLERIPTCEQDLAGANEAPRRPRLKILGHLARAVKRFQASLNPRMSFGRRETPEGEDTRLSEKRSISAPIDSRSVLTADYQRSATGRLPTGPVSPSSRNTHTHRGHITSYLFAPLPALKSEASRA